MKKITTQTTSAYRKNPKAFGLKIVSSLVVVAALFGSWQWWQSRPKPQYCAVNVSPPSPPSTTFNTSSDLILSFGCSAALLSQVGQEITEGLRIEPQIKGTWKWTSDRVLHFQPQGTYLENDWRAGEPYTVSFSKKLFSNSIKLESYETEFKPRAFKSTLNNFSFAVDAKNPSLRRVSGTVYFNWPIEPESFRKHVELRYNKVSGPLTQSESEIPASVSFNDTFTEAYISSENLPVPEIESTVKVKIKRDFQLLSGALSTDPLEKAAKVPGRKGSFQLSESRIIYARNARYEPEQIFVVDSNLEIASEELGQRTKLWLLPAKRSKKEEFNYQWNSFAEVDSNVLSQSTPVLFEVLPSETPLSKLHTLKLKETLPFERYIYVEITGNLKAYGDYELGDSYVATAVVPSTPKELKIQGEGVLLSLSGERKLSVAARGVNKVEVEVSRVLPTQINQLMRSLNYTDMSDLSLYQGTSDAFSEVFTKPVNLASTDPTKTEYFSVDMDEFLKKGQSNKGLFYIRLNEKNGGTYDQRLILLTDLGFIAKRSAQGSYDVFVQDLTTGMAVYGASVEVIGANGLPAYSTQTDTSGKAEIPPLRDLSRERLPIAIVVRQGESLSFLPINSSGNRVLETSRFDTGGVYESTESDALSAMIFSDRGIYRPGETVKIGMIVRSKNLKTAKSSIPLKWVVSDSRGTEIAKQAVTVSTGNLFEIEVPTRPESATGSWYLQLLNADPKKSSESIGSTTFRIEEFQPDRMKITSTFSRTVDEGWTSPDDLKGNVTLKNLFGTPAQNRRITANMSLSPLTPSFKKYKDYRFAPLHGKDERFLQTPLNDQVTDNEGKTSFSLNLDSVGSGLYSLRLEAEGYENETGGRSVLTGNRILVSHLPYLVGVKTDGDLSYINTDSERVLALLAINPSLDTIALTELNLILNEKKYVSSLIKDSNGAYKYQSIQRELEVSNIKVKVPKKGLNWKIPTEKAGDYVLILKTPEGVELNRIDFSVVGNDIQVGRMDRNAELQLKLSKSDYKAGESIEMEIRAPYAGRGLITIERDQVYTHKWFKASGSKTVETIRVPEGLEGNAYVHVSFLRDINSKEIYMSPLSYAIAPFSLARESFETKIELEAPERVRPGEKFEIQYSTSKPTDLVIWGVDEGILQVAKYETPSPLDFFLRKKALQVSTMQILDLLMPEYSIIRGLLSPGGDASDDGAMLGKGLNPFRRNGQKPVVFWSGILKATSKKQVFQYTVPDYYNGALRIFALASSKEGMGVQKTNTTVQGDIILSPSSPLASAPEDVFEVSVSVSNQTAGSGKNAKVDLELETDSIFEQITASKVKLEINEGDEKTHRFKLKTKNGPFGAKNLKVIARVKGSEGIREAHYNFDISVRPITPYIHKEEFRVSKDLPQTFKLPELHETLNKSQILISNNALDLGEALGNYLVGFPYGCTEQILSKAISQMVIKSRFGKSAEESFTEALSQLRTRQLDDGSFSLYPGTESNLLASVWTIQFLTESEKRGLPVPRNMLDQSIKYANELKFENNMSNYEARWTSLGVYLQTRQGRVPTANLAAFEENILKKRKDMDRDLATIFLAGTYKLLKQDKRADALIEDINFDSAILPEPYAAYNGMTRNAALLLVAARHFPEKLNELMETENIALLLEPLQKGQVQTLSAGLTLLALDEVGRSSAQKPKNEFKNESSQQVLRTGESVELDFQRVDTGAFIASIIPNAKELTIKGSSQSPLISYVQSSGFEMPKNLQEIKQGLEITRTYLDESGRPVGDKVAQGATVKVLLRVRSLKGTVSNVAVVDLIPSGFEIQLDESATGDVDYADRREDRVVVYLTASEQSTEYVYKIKAVSRGEFSVAPTFGEALYNRETRYRGTLSKITIE